MPSAIFRRRPMTLMSSVPFRATLATPPMGMEGVAADAPPAMWRSRSAWLMRPAGPDPATSWRSMLAARARWRTAGDARALVPAARATGAADAVAAGGAGAGSGCFVSTTGSGFSSTGSGFSSTGSEAWLALPSPSTSKTMQTPPTGRMSPASPTMLTTVPSHGEGISTVALSVMTDKIGSSSLTVSPTATIHSTISPSTTPSPMSGILNSNFPMFSPPVFCVLLLQCEMELGDNPIQWCGGTGCPSL